MRRRSCWDPIHWPHLTGISLEVPSKGVRLPGGFAFFLFYWLRFSDRFSCRFRSEAKEPHQSFEVLDRHCQVELFAYVS